MPLQLPVLVRGINNLSDARYCAGMGADGLIFTLDPSLPGAVTPDLVKELAGWVSGVELIGEFSHTTAAKINQLVTECGLSRVLLAPGAAVAPTEIAVPLLPLAVYSAALPAAAYADYWVSGLLGPADVARLLVEQPAGLILQGGDEIKPGLRDFTELEAIFEALETE